MELVKTILESTLEHIGLAYGSLAISIILAIPLAVLALYIKRLAPLIMAIANLVEAVPSFAVVAIVVPLMGIGFKPAIIAIMIRALLPVIKNTYIGLNDVDPSLIDSARGMGLTNWQILIKVRFPHSYAPMFSGIKFAAILTNGIAVLTAIIGSGGLGSLVFEGLASFNTPKILLGVIPVMLIAIIADILLTLAENKLTPAALKHR